MLRCRIYREAYLQMKLLICSMSSALGGLERRIEDETRLLTAKGHEVVVATPHFEGLDEWRFAIQAAGGKHIEWAPYKFVERQHFATPFRWLALTSLPALLREQFDFAHLTLQYNYIGMSMAYLLGRAKIPFVVAMHGKCNNKALSQRGRAVVKEAMCGMVGGYAVSQPVNELFMHLYAGLLPPASSLVTINNGINVARFKPDASARASVRKSLGLEEKHFTVVFCGRIQAVKRPLFAAAVFARFHSKHQNARLLVVGNGPDAAALNAAIGRLGIQRSVILVGHVPVTADYYAASDCYLSTSINEEGCPLAMAEALASGLPAVAPNDDVFRSVYVACPSVYLCDPASQVGWDHALMSIAVSSDSERTRASNDAENFANANLTLEIMNQKLSSFYDATFTK